MHVFSKPAYRFYGQNNYKMSYSKQPEHAEHDSYEVYPEQTIEVYTNKHKNEQLLK